MEGRNDRVWNDGLWNLLDEYADIRDELEDVLINFHELHAEIELAMDEITDGLEELQGHLKKCSSKLRGLQNPMRDWFKNFDEEQEELPFSD